MEDSKITLEDDEETLDFYVIEQTRFNGKNYLLVTDTEGEYDAADCYILRDMSDESDEDALYEFVDDDDELEAVMDIFAQLIEDTDIITE